MTTDTATANHQAAPAVVGPVDPTVVPLAPKRVTFAFASGMADPLKPGNEGRRFFVAHLAGREAMSSREPGISDGAGVAPARFSLLLRGACGSGVDPRQPLTLRMQFYADHKRHNAQAEPAPAARGKP